MNMGKLIKIVMVVLFVTPTILFAATNNTVQSNSLLPMGKGTFWKYRVTKKYCEKCVSAKDMKLSQKIITLTVVENILFGKNNQASLIKSDDGNEVYTMLAYHNEFYVVTGSDAFAEAKQKKTGDIITLKSEEQKYNIMFAWPVTVGQLFNCDNNTKKRGDKYYCNWVKRKSTANKQHFPGKAMYEIKELTLSGTDTSYWVPGVGLVEERYTHNGTPDDENRVLIEYKTSN